MSEEPNVHADMPGTEGQQQSSQAEQGWQEVGRQFQTLGASIAQAMRTAWEDETNQRQIRAMRTGLESMVKDVSKAIEDGANSPKGAQIRQEAGRTVEAIGQAGRQTVQEVRPHLITALEQLNDELQKLIARMEKKESPAPASPETPETPQDSDSPQI